MNEAGPTPVLLLGEGLTLLGAIRCFGRAGIPAFVLTGPDALAQRSRWFRSLPSYSISTGDYEGLAALLSRLEIETAVLVPCSDPWAAAVSGLEPSLAERFPSVVADAEVIELLVDKGKFGRLLAEMDIPHPRTFDLVCDASLDQIPEDVLTRGFLKPRDSMAFVETYGTKAFDFSGRGEAKQLLQKTRDAGLSMMLQEYIPGAPDQHYFIDGVVDRCGAFSVLFARQRLRIHPARFGNSTAVRSIALAEVSGAVASLQVLAERIRLRGIFSAEFKRDARDGVFKLIEVNPRPWWYVEFAATCGADVCVPAYRDALGLPAGQHRRYRVDARLVYPYHDWLAWRRQKPDGTSLVRMLAFWIGASQARWRSDDPMPSVYSLACDSRTWLQKKRSAKFKDKPVGN